ncbi:uncharacterized protein LOC134753705 [Cydia strobilella]|uniref:uncharacterized protein LOC134753705 n=1 Tax=Cydia strobilella TaxID=1100964 RepID=UPI003006A87A
MGIHQQSEGENKNYAESYGEKYDRAAENIQNKIRKNQRKNQARLGRRSEIDGMTDSEQTQPITNEFLAFLQLKNKLVQEGAMDAVTAVQMSSRASSFAVEDICAAKQVLCQSLGIVGTYVPHRRGDEAGKKSLEDIMKILSENKDRIPEFVATGAPILPSCAPDNVDVRLLFKEIVALNTRLAEVIMKFEASLVTIAELRDEITCLRNAPTRSAVSNFKSDYRPDTCVESVSLRAADTAKCAARAAAPPAHPPRERPPPVSSKSLQRAYADVAGQSVAANRVNAPSKACKSRAPLLEKSSRTNVDKEGFTLVERKRKARRSPRKTLCGTAEPVNSGLRIATPSKALYVSRLHYSAGADEVVEYIRRKTGYTLRVHQLQSRHYVHFSSFVVPSNAMSCGLQVGSGSGRRL